MNNNELMSKLFDYSSPTYFRWKKENRPIIKLIEKYFSKEDLEEFLLTGEITRLEDSKKSDIKTDNLNEVLIEHTKYQLKEKLKNWSDKDTLEWIYHFFAKKILLKALENLELHNKESILIMNSKDFLINEIKNTDIGLMPKPKRDVLLKMIDEELSNLECYILIYYYEEVMNYKNRFSIKSKFNKE